MYNFFLKNQEEGRFLFNISFGMFGSLGNILYLCRVKTKWQRPQNKPFLFTIKNTRNYEQNIQNYSGNHCRHLRRALRRCRCTNPDVKPSNVMENTRFKISQYACAVLLVVSSIALVGYQVVMIDDVSNGLLVYVAQAFLLVASIFGLDYYVKLITRKINGKHNQ